MERVGTDEGAAGEARAGAPAAREAPAAWTALRVRLAVALRLPEIAIEPADRREWRIAGVALPARATVALLGVSLIALLDWHGRFAALLPGSDPAVARGVAFGIGALLLVIAGLRDRPARYGLGPGDAGAGVAFVLAGWLLLAPVYLLVLQGADFRAYYAPLADDPGRVVLHAIVELLPAEFLFRGLLLFALLRAIGPLGLLVATLPFALIHLGKPELETLSTLVGGAVYGWLDWRTGSVLWSGIAHVGLLTFAVLVAGALGA